MLAASTSNTRAEKIPFSSPMEVVATVKRQGFLFSFRELQGFDRIVTKEVEKSKKYDDIVTIHELNNKNIGLALFAVQFSSVKYASCDTYDLIFKHAIKKEIPIICVITHSENVDENDLAGYERCFKNRFEVLDMKFVRYIFTCCVSSGPLEPHFREFREKSAETLWDEIMKQTKEIHRNTIASNNSSKIALFPGAQEIRILVFGAADVGKKTMLGHLMNKKVKYDDSHGKELKFHRIESFAYLNYFLNISLLSLDGNTVESTSNEIMGDSNCQTHRYELMNGFNLIVYVSKDIKYMVYQKQIYSLIHKLFDRSVPIMAVITHSENQESWKLYAEQCESTFKEHEMSFDRILIATFLDHGPKSKLPKMEELRQESSKCILDSIVELAHIEG